MQLLYIDRHCSVAVREGHVRYRLQLRMHYSSPPICLIYPWTSIKQTRHITQGNWLYTVRPEGIVGLLVLTWIPCPFPPLIYRMNSNPNIPTIHIRAKHYTWCCDKIMTRKFVWCLYVQWSPHLSGDVTMNLNKRVYDGISLAHCFVETKKTSSFNHADHSVTIWRVNVKKKKKRVALIMLIIALMNWS